MVLIPTTKDVAGSNTLIIGDDLAMLSKSSEITGVMAC